MRILKLKSNKEKAIFRSPVNINLQVFVTLWDKLYLISSTLRFTNLLSASPLSKLCDKSAMSIN